MDMKQANKVVKKFFEDFERASNMFEGEELGLLFSDPFMTADPDGGIRVTGRGEFVEGVAKREAFFRGLGLRFVRIVPLEGMWLDEQYMTVRVETHMQFEKEAGRVVDVKDDATYILFVKDDSAKVVFNLTHEDLMKVMRDHGLLPGK